MKRILVSLLSKYLQPNFLFIKEMDGKYDKLVFVTTNGMEKDGVRSTAYLCKALGIAQKKVNTISVIEDDANDVEAKLKNYGFVQENEYIVNLTGGTKIMSLCVHDFFCSYSDVGFYYIPEGKNVIKKLRSDEPVMKLNYRMNLEEYFTINRLKFEYKKDMVHDEKTANILFDKMRAVNFNKRRVEELNNWEALDDNTEKMYYSGAWFEEYVYYRLKRENGLTSDCICTSAKIFREDATSHDNEIDVMFIKNNKLYIFECKQSLSGIKESNKSVVDGYMYKLAAIAKDYGLKVNSYIMTLHKKHYFPDVTLDNIDKRIAILGLKNIVFSDGFCNSYINIGEI